MTEKYTGRSELAVAHNVGQIAALPFGLGLVGRDRHLEGVARQRYVEALGRHQHQIPKGLLITADCMDERFILRFANGLDDPNKIAARVAGSLPGGLVLATMKAGVAANAAFLRDAKTSKAAYETTFNMLQGFGYQDAAHADCGASKHVQNSVASRLDLPTLGQTFVAVGAKLDVIDKPLRDLERTKYTRLESGFYGDWDQIWHEEYVSSRVPENFAHLRTDHTPTHGHNASGLLLAEEGFYFAKNAFIEDTEGLEAFSLTFGLADQVVDRIGGSEQEKTLMKLAYRDDAFNVANQIVAGGLEVFAGIV
jgi:hypothetical protein